MRLIATIFSLCFSIYSFAQIISVSPSNGGAADELTLIFDASQGNKELVGASKVYIHHGVVTDKPDGTSWKYVKGNWGKDDGIGLMSKVPGTTDKWQIKFSPDLRSYFGVPAGEEIYRISCVFRSADGSKKGTIAPGNYGWGTVASNFDYYVNLNIDNFIFFSAPQNSEAFHYSGDQINIKAETSGPASIRLLLDEGNGYKEAAQVSNTKLISFNYSVTSSLLLKMKAIADFNGTMVEKEQTLAITVINNNPPLPLPEGMKSGVNIGSDGSVTLVLLAPNKQYVFAVGDFNNWTPSPDYQMNKTPDGKYFWLTLDQLEKQKDYVYQYWIDGKIKVADPYTRQVADPWNDEFIEPYVFPDLPSYNRKDYGIASVFRIENENYSWSGNESTWKRPDIEHLMIYELHIRDFLASHSLKDLADTIIYLKRLGVQAIELMPINEFEGNDSWGYNPSFYFAVDKYYGKANDLKGFIDLAHQNGMAVIMDIVLNHAFGQCPMVQMYFDPSTGKPAADNPWFNREYVGQYQWGYDFNHESQYTKDFIDEVNRFWLEEFHFDGFRFDFTKGFTNNAPGGSVDGFDQSRINILKRMVSKIKEVDAEAYVILEHWAPDSEEAQLAAAGMKMWRNKTYDYVPATVGNITGSFDRTDATTHVCFLDSHDERRIAEWCLADGRANGSYNIKTKEVMYERVKMAAAFMFLMPGPKMIWQFDELGYDINIDFNGRVGRKPLAWGDNSLRYYENEYRQYIYQTYQQLLSLRYTLDPAKLKSATKSHALTGDVRRLTYNTTDVDMTMIGNFATTDKSIDARFTQTGWWYDYFSGDSVNVTTLSVNVIPLKAGEWRIYTSKKLTNGFPNVVEVYSNPVTITPNPFKEGENIKVRFDAKKASKNNTAGLVGASEVYMVAGYIPTTANDEQLINIIGDMENLSQAAMTKVGDEIWEISLVPETYFNLPQDEHIYEIGMWFRDGTNTNLGYGFRNTIVFGDALSEEPIVEIIPPSFKADEEIRLIFNARQGNRELVGAEKVYLHSGVGTVNTNNPQASAWNKVVGNWGADDGIGLMEKVAGSTDKWEITLVPKDYYKLGATEVPYWIAAVFRNANGTAKGTGPAGQILNGFIASNQDYFIKNLITVDVEEEYYGLHPTIFPNPAQHIIQFRNLPGGSRVIITDVNGKSILKIDDPMEGLIDIMALPSGMYHARAIMPQGSLIIPLIKI